MVDLAYQDLGNSVQERFAVQHFIDALSDKEDRLYLRREKPSTLDDALSLARELESLRLLDSNNSLRQADTKVRAIETEQTQLQTEVDGLKLKIEEQQHKLEAQANIIAQLHQFLAKQQQPQGPPGEGGNVGFVESGHLRKQCPRYRARPASTQPSGNGRRVSPRAREDA